MFLFLYSIKNNYKQNIKSQIYGGIQLHKKILQMLLMVFLIGFLNACSSVYRLEDSYDYVDSQMLLTFVYEGNQHQIMFYNYYNILKVSEEPLFLSGGEINRQVLENLMAIINAPTLDPLLREEKRYWPSGLSFEYDTPFTSITASDFSNFVVPAPENASHSGAIIIKLFETIPNRYGIEHGHLTELTSQWWQLVYRSTDDNQDVLTLWMVNPYRLTYFNGTANNYGGEHPNRRYGTWGLRNDDGNGFSHSFYRIPITHNIRLSDEQIVRGLKPTDNFFFEANYSQSIVRSNLLRDLDFLLAEFSNPVFNLQNFLVAPIDIPANWQSSYFQTGTNWRGHYFKEGQEPISNIYPGSVNYLDGLGASGRWGRIESFNINNGKDGLSAGIVIGGFPNSRAQPTYYDLLWLPSEFEIRIMGHSKDTPNVQTFIRNINQPNTDLVFDIDTNNSPIFNGNSVISEYGRTGLWRLNGFDRCFNPYALGNSEYFHYYAIWTRSAITNALGNGNVVSATGNRYGNGVSQLAGLRPAVHLSLTQLSIHLC